MSATSSPSMQDTFFRIAAGAFIPAAGAFIFNILHAIFEEIQKKEPNLVIPPSVYDVANGCMLSLVGVLVGFNKVEHLKRYTSIAVMLFLLLLFCNFIAPYAWGWDKHITIWFMNVLAMAILSAAIYEGDRR